MGVLGETSDAVDRLRKNEKRDAIALFGGATSDCGFGEVEVVFAIDAAEGVGGAEVIGLLIPMSFIVACKRSRSRLSSSSSVVSNFRADTTEVAPGRKLRGRRLGFGSVFFSDEPPNIENPFQSKDMDRR